MRDVFVSKLLIIWQVCEVKRPRPKFSHSHSSMCDNFLPPRSHRMQWVGVGGAGVPRGGGSPAAAMCSLVLIGWKPTKGTCMDRTSPTM